MSSFGFGFGTGIAKKVGGVSYDADASAFFTAASITDTTQKSAVNQLVLDLKSYGIWTKSLALYPVVGGSASSHAVNLKTPGTFNLSFSTGWTHSSTGMTPNGTSAYANTFFIPSLYFSTNVHISFYSRTQTVGASQAEFGGNPGAASYLWMRTAQNFVSGGGAATILNFTTTTDARGHWIGSKRSNTDRAIFRNGTKEASKSTSDTLSFDGISLFLSAANVSGTAQNYSSKQCAFASIGNGLTDTEAANFYTAVQAYQTTLNRQV